jgi:hypothetical protein
MGLEGIPSSHCLGKVEGVLRSSGEPWLRVPELTGGEGNRLLSYPKVLEKPVTHIPSEKGRPSDCHMLEAGPEARVSVSPS